VHVLPQLRELEQRFPRELVVIGVHSGKFIAERETARIRAAARRLGATHPIVNDRQFRVWRNFAVRAWPTLAVIDPDGYVLGLHAGEFTASALVPLIERLVARGESTGTLRRGASPFEPGEPASRSTDADPHALRYPGKVALGSDGRIAIADSGNHRVLVGSLGTDGRSMRVRHVLGGPEAGNRDGASGEARFASPQGLAFHRDALYVADAENHLVRAIDVASGAVRTVAGTGRQLRTAADLRDGALSSPWDLAVADDALFVAMAGVHQLWKIGLATGEARPHAGARGENLMDGPLLEALLAQPMGLTTDGRDLYFADAESSAIRRASVDVGGSVSTLVGTGLFEFGDRDGAGDAVRLEHPQGVALHPSGRLLVADSYNDALKWVDRDTREATTWRRGFSEPAGLAIGRGVVYVADTNAHRVAVVDEATGEVVTLAIE